jgi:hypothetical protein
MGIEIVMQPKWLRFIFSAGQVLVLASITTAAGFAQRDAAGSSAGKTPVSIQDDGTNFILSNGYITASISKTTGDMVSLKYHGLETMGYVSGHHAGYWEQNPSGAARKAAPITIDPAKNDGERGEVSIKGWSDGKSILGGGPDPGARNEPVEHPDVGRGPGPKRPPNLVRLQAQGAVEAVEGAV